MNAFVYDVVRTPRGKGREGGALSQVKPIDLLAQLFASLAERNPSLSPHDVDDVVLGCSTPRGELGSNIARIAALYAGWGAHASGTTVNRFCASGLDALHTASARVASGASEVIIAGGIEHPSRVPMMSDGGAWFEDVTVAKKTGFLHMAVAADLLATLEGFSREELDEVALRSHELAAGAWRERAFSRSIVGVRDEKGETVLAHDECIRATTKEKLAALPPLFPEGDRSDRVALRRYPELEMVKHLHSAGTSPALADGAALSVVASIEAGNRLGLKPRARVMSFADVASEPVVMLSGNPAATQKAVTAAGLRLDQIDRFEVNESFAAVPLHFVKKLAIDPAKLNVNGGAIAMGHPLGATGIVLLATLIDELERSNGRYGVLSICAASGIASATVVERLAT